jgi:hypothetical protein
MNFGSAGKLAVALAGIVKYRCIETDTYLRDVDDGKRIKMVWWFCNKREATYEF